MLRGEFVDLRAIERTDIGLVAKWWNDPEAMFWWGCDASVVSLERVARLIDQWLTDEELIGHPVALIVETLDREAIGLVLLSDVQTIDRNVELGILLDETWRHRGIGSDVIELITETLFDTWGYHRITVRCEEANTPAQRFFRKHGFELEGRLREARYRAGRWNDILVFGRIDEPTETI